MCVAWDYAAHWSCSIDLLQLQRREERDHARSFSLALVALLPMLLFNYSFDHTDRAKALRSAEFVFYSLAGIQYKANSIAFKL